MRRNTRKSKKRISETCYLYWKSFIIIAAILVSVKGNSQSGNDELMIGSYNIRWNTPADGINIWDNRKEWLTESIKFFEIDIVGAQEVTFSQLRDIELLLPDYISIGTGREGGIQGEFSPIFYVENRFELIDSNTFWLSETPEEIASKGWDAALPRIVTWAKFRDKKNRKTFFFFNTHFDHRGKEARINSAKLLSSKINSIAGNEPVILTGDFNTPPNSDPYMTLLESGIEDASLKAEMSYTPGYTFNGWNVEAEGNYHIIDYVFYKSNELIPRKYHVLDGQRGKRFISDHFPVLVKFKWMKIKK